MPDDSDFDDVTPMKPVDGDTAGEPDVDREGVDEDGVGVAPDPTGPLKREGDDDMPGLDPTTPVIAPG